jgi:hypothetical protein
LDAILPQLEDAANRLSQAVGGGRSTLAGSIEKEISTPAAAATSTQPRY